MLGEEEEEGPRPLQYGLPVMPTATYSSGHSFAEAMIRDSVIDWQELSALYEQAEGLDESGREAFLAPLRSQKHRLLGQLERMLRARDRIATSSFLESLPRLETALSPSAAPSDLAEGSRVGPYRLVRPIGSGGMAEVWLAERADGAFDRQVAIKLLFNYPTRSERSGFVARFVRERYFLASLHLPHIAGLHDAGVTTSGEPLLALEYVRGDPIAAWCDKKQLALGAVRFYRSREEDARAWAGALPAQLDWDDSPDTLRAKVGRKPTEQEEDPLSGFARWRMPTHDLHVLYSTVANRLTRIFLLDRRFG